ncbi:MAG: hypothetical protein WAV28_17540, partial [Sedimentisphaerales bacterium]
ALEAATHSLVILLGGILKAEGFGDGFSLAKHIRAGEHRCRQEKFTLSSPPRSPCPDNIQCPALRFQKMQKKTK